MGKLPFMKFYPDHWIADSRLLSIDAKGAWIDLLCVMWNGPERGEISGTVEQLARLLGCSTELTESIIAQFSALKICDVDVVTPPPCNGSCNALVTLRSRR